MGDTIKWTELLHVKTDILKLQFCIHLKKKVHISPEAFITSFRMRPVFNRLKNMSAGVNGTRSATRVLVRERGLEPKVNVFLLQKVSNLGPVLIKPLQLKCVTEGPEPPAAT